MIKAAIKTYHFKKSDSNKFVYSNSYVIDSMKRNFNIKIFHSFILHLVDFYIQSPLRKYLSFELRS